MPSTLRLRLTALSAIAATFALTTGCVASGLPAQAPPGVRVIRDLAYVPGGDAAQVLDLYLPEQASAKPLPLFVWIHGGGWTGGSKDGPYGLDLVGKGYAVASVELADALRKVKVDAILQRLTGSGHGGPAFDQPAVRKLVQDFLDKHLRGAAVQVEAVPGT